MTVLEGIGLSLLIFYAACAIFYFRLGRSRTKREQEMLNKYFTEE